MQSTGRPSFSDLSRRHDLGMAKSQRRLMCRLFLLATRWWTQPIDDSGAGRLVPPGEEANLTLFLDSHIRIAAPSIRIQPQISPARASRIALILAADFQAQPSDWNRPSASNGDLVTI